MIPPRVYKVHFHDGGSYWVLRLPAWIGWLRDRYHELRYGFKP